MVSAQEIARDLIIAALNAKQLHLKSKGSEADAKDLGIAYAEVLKQVRSAWSGQGTSTS